MVERLILKRIVPGEYTVIQGVTEVGNIIRDGTPGVDNYPWTWSLAESPYGSGPAATKAAALDALASHLRKKAAVAGRVSPLDRCTCNHVRSYHDSDHRGNWGRCERRLLNRKRCPCRKFELEEKKG